MEVSSNECVDDLAPRRAALSVGSVRLSYLRWGGQGTPAILLHGITSSARTWWRVAPKLAARGYDVYAFDMPGHGESDSIEAHAIDEIAALIAQAAGSLMSEPPLVVGHSWGGAAALALALQLPPMRLALIDPLLALSPSTHASWTDTFLVGVGDLPEVTLPRLRAANPDWHACDVFWKAEALEQCRASAVRGLFTGSGDWNVTAHLGAIDAPLLLLLADPAHSVVPPAVLAAAQAALRPDLGKCVTIAGAPHNLFRGNAYQPFMRELMLWVES
jgi:pimeloyl-ACP methyl ester carboxylesterase